MKKHNNLFSKITIKEKIQKLIRILQAMVFYHKIIDKKLLVLNTICLDKNLQI